MRILLTGANGYIGKRLLPILVDCGHEVICCVRDTNRFSPPDSLTSRITVIQVDLLDRGSLQAALQRRDRERIPLPIARRSGQHAVRHDQPVRRDG